MLRPAARTDREMSIRSKEFVWDVTDDPEAHQYLVPPVEKILKTAAAKTVLDLGCGNGALAGHLASIGYLVTGCDYSESGIERARVQHPGIPFFQHDVTEELPPMHHGGYDAVVSTEVIEHLLLPRKLMGNAFRALKPGGIFVASTPYHGYWKNLMLAMTNKFDDHWHPLRDYGHVKFFSRRTLTALFAETGFQNIGFITAGRIPALACSMLVCGTKPS